MARIALQTAGKRLYAAPCVAGRAAGGARVEATCLPPSSPHLERPESPAPSSASGSTVSAPGGGFAALATVDAETFSYLDQPGGDNPG